MAEPPGPHVGQDAEDARAVDADVPKAAIDDNDIFVSPFRSVIGGISKNRGGDTHRNRLISCYFHFDDCSDYTTDDCRYNKRGSYVTFARAVRPSFAPTSISIRARYLKTAWLLRARILP